MTVPFPTLRRRLVAILRGLRPDEALAIGAAVFEAGIEAIEVPLNSPDPFRSIEMLAKSLPASALVGAGTVLTAAQVDSLHQAGGRLLVSPNIDRAVMERAGASRHGHHARRLHADRSIPRAVARRIGAEILSRKRARRQRAFRRSRPCCPGRPSSARSAACRKRILPSTARSGSRPSGWDPASTRRG